MRYISEIKCDWIHTFPFKTEDLAGFNCSKKLGLGRVMIPLVIELTNLKDDEEIELPQDESKFTKHNKYWLKIRGLDTTGNAGELKQCVMDEKKKDQLVEILPKPSITQKDIIEFMTIWHTVLCNIMARTTTKEHCEKNTSINFVVPKQIH